MDEKKVGGLGLTVAQRRALVDADHASLSVRRQCALLGLNRSTLYYEAATTSTENLTLMNAIDRHYTEYPWEGSRRIVQWLGRQGHAVNRKRVQRLLRVMHLEAIYPRKRAGVASAEHRVYPYLLRGVAVAGVDEVWGADITYIGLPKGFMYLMAVMDWHSRYVLGWRLSNSLDGSIGVELLDELLRQKVPRIFNTDQGVQFTAHAFTGRLEAAGAAVSMNGRGRCMDNIFVERLWRTVKYEDIYLRGYETVAELRAGLTRYFTYYNEQRPHQGLDNRTPAEVYHGSP